MTAAALLVHHPSCTRAYSSTCFHPSDVVIENRLTMTTIKRVHHIQGICCNYRRHMVASNGSTSCQQAAERHGTGSNHGGWCCCDNDARDVVWALKPFRSNESSFKRRTCLCRTSRTRHSLTFFALVIGATSPLCLLRLAAYLLSAFIHHSLAAAIQNSRKEEGEPSLS